MVRGLGHSSSREFLLINTNFFIEVLQSVQHSQLQLMEEIRQLKADKTKEKGSQHDPKQVVDKEETPVGGGP